RRWPRSSRRSSASASRRSRCRGARSATRRSRRSWPSGRRRAGHVASAHGFPPRASPHGFARRARRAARGARLARPKGRAARGAARPRRHRRALAALPRALRARAAEPTPGSTLPAMAERVLLIDDDESLAAMLAEYLRGFGFEVEARSDAERGLAALARGGFDAVILDVMLPDLDGFEVCRRIRARS